MNRFFEAFNELPKPPFADKLPALDTLKQLAPEIPNLLLTLLQKPEGHTGSLGMMQGAKSKMVRIAVIIAESIFNQQLYLQPALKSQKAALEGHSLTIFLQEVGESITLVFSETRVDILVDAEYEADCQLSTDFKTLLKLRDKQQLTTLLKEDAITVTGDIDVLQKLNQFVDKIEPGIGAILSPVIGDLAAGLIESIIKLIFDFVKLKASEIKTWVTEAFTEGVQLMPHPNANAYAKAKA